MKKRKRIVIAALTALLAVLPLAACGGGPDALVFCVPDGAPALAAAKLMYDQTPLGGRETEYRVVSAETIGAQVAQKTADVALLPVTAAGMAAGNGYRMVSVNTHGNIYLIGFGAETAPADFVGKKIGVVQLAKVPGLTFQAILAAQGTPYAPSALAGAADPGKVNLVGLTEAPGAALLQNKVDALVVPEPALGSILATCAEQGRTVTVNLALHDLYREAFDTAQAYPQAVLVVKRNLLDRAFANELLSGLDANGAWVKSAPAAALQTVAAHLPPDTKPSFQRLDAAIYDRCNIYTVKAADAKDNVKAYLEAVNALHPDDPSLRYAIPADDFFYAE